MNDDSDDTNIDHNLNTKPSTIYTDKLINDKVEDSSKRKSQVSIYDFVNVKKKFVSKAGDINIFTTECHSDATSRLDSVNKATIARMDSLILLEKKRVD